MTSAITAASTLASACGSAIASPTSNTAPVVPGRWRAKAICPGEGSMPCTEAGAQRCISSSVKAPLPQPTSSQCRPAGGATNCRKRSPARRLQRPMKAS